MPDREDSKKSPGVRGKDTPPQGDFRCESRLGVSRESGNLVGARRSVNPKGPARRELWRRGSHAPESWEGMPPGPLPTLVMTLIHCQDMSLTIAAQRTWRQGHQIRRPENGAGNGIRTRDPRLGRPML